MDTKEQASKTIGRTSEMGREAAEKNQQESKSVASSGKNVLSQEIERLGSALHTASAKLREQNDTFADWTESVADRADNASNYLREKSPSEIVSLAQDYSRRNPGFALGIMFLSGFALARFLKAGRAR